ncbi:MAG: DUF3488 and transglutaminase-like domain-containing protein [Pseudomonadota bacterium]
MIDYLTQTTLLRLLAVLVLVLAPHVVHLPLWENLLLAAIIVWRALISVRQWRLPAPWIRNVISIVCFAAVYFNFNSISGLTAGTALLSVMAVLKLLEMRARRDVMVLVLLMYFILTTHFLFSQELWTIAYLLLSAVCITALLMDCNHAGESLPTRVLLRAGAIMVAQALPLMLIFFVLFPRIPGPLWSLPTDSGAGRTGLSDKMSPGDIASLMQTDEVVFRVRFPGEVPTPQQRYWRGPVFDQFDGRGWQSSNLATQTRSVTTAPIGETLSYELTMEASGSRLMLALDTPAPKQLPRDSALNYSNVLIAAGPINERRVYKGTAYTQYVLQPTLSDLERAHFLQIPEGYNPRTRRLAQQWRASGIDDAEIVNKALLMFRSEKFFYTLQPPKLGRDSIDEFIFNTKQGFCEHYSSSFTFLMRAAGIPARVITGYQGGEQNPLSDYYVVRQYDAHAWSEVWLAEKGWVRVDPTGAVAPQRVERGFTSSISLANGLPGFIVRQQSNPLRFAFNMRWDLINQKWNAWVLAYGPDLQADFLRNFGIEDWSQMILVMTVLLVLGTLVVSLLLMRQFATVIPRDHALRLWQRALKKLAKVGITQGPDEGPRDFVNRITRDHPAYGDGMQRVLQAYLKTRYLEEADQAAERELNNAVAAFKPRR